MKFLSTFLDSIKEKWILSSLLDDIKDLDEVLLEKRLEIFAEVVTPRFAEIGLTNWDGRYRWFSDFNQEGVKHVVEYNVTKFYGGYFFYGNCFKFIPTISGKKLQNHKTDKSTKLLYYNRLGGWDSKSIKVREKSFERNKVSTINEKKFSLSLKDVLDRNLSELSVWFDKNKTIKDNIKRQLTNVEEDNEQLRTIKSEYILAFLFHQVGDFENSQRWINLFFTKSSIDENLRELIEERLT